MILRHDNICVLQKTLTLLCTPNMYDIHNVDRLLIVDIPSPPEMIREKSAKDYIHIPGTGVNNSRESSFTRNPTRNISEGATENIPGTAA